MTSTPKISVIVPTFQGGKRLPVILDSLQRQTIKAFELIISVDGSTDQSLLILENETRFPDLKILFEDNGGRAIAKNRGARVAGGEILLFFDDDMILPEDCIQKHVEFHRCHLFSAVGGNPHVYIQENSSDFMKYYSSISQKWGSYTNQCIRLSSERFHLSAANFSIHRTLFADLNGFDERLKDSEDLELAYRIVVGAGTLFYDPVNIAYHNPSYDSLVDYIVRRREYYNGIKALSKINPYFQSHTIIRQGNMVKKLLYRVFGTYIMLKVGNVLSKNNTFIPDKIKFTVFSLIIHSWSRIYPEKSLLHSGK